MLVDPRSTVHAYSAVLPVKTLSLPQRYIDGPLANMAPSFRTGPILTRMASAQDTSGGGKSNAQTALIPPPAARGTWRWHERTLDPQTEPATQSWSEPIGLSPPDGAAHLSSALPSLREGLLVLTGAIDDDQNE